MTPINDSFTLKSLVQILTDPRNQPHQFVGASRNLAEMMEWAVLDEIEWRERKEAMACPPGWYGGMRMRGLRYPLIANTPWPPPPDKPKAPCPSLIARCRACQSTMEADRWDDLHRLLITHGPTDSGHRLFDVIDSAGYATVWWKGRTLPSWTPAEAASSTIPVTSWCPDTPWILLNRVGGASTRVCCAICGAEDRLMYGTVPPRKFQDPFADFHRHPDLATRASYPKWKRREWAPFAPRYLPEAV
jgi:hypothetical protein